MIDTRTDNSWSIAYGVNDQGDSSNPGEICGTWRYASGYSRAFLKLFAANHGLSAALHDLGCLAGSNSEGRAVNEDGLVTGSSEQMDGMAVVSKAMLWRPQASPNMISLGNVVASGGYYGYAYVGYARCDGTSPMVVGQGHRSTTAPDGTPGSSGTVRFYWTSATGSIATTWGNTVRMNSAWGVNNSQRAVGGSWRNIFPEFAWYWDYSTNLETELPFHGWSEQARAYAINANNVIVGCWSESGQAVRWDP